MIEHEEHLEDIRVCQECNKILKEISFNEKLNMLNYKIYREIKDRGGKKICNNCNWYDSTKRKCISNITEIHKQRLCLKAYNTYKLKEQDLYGRKTRIDKKCVD